MSLQVMVSDPWIAPHIGEFAVVMLVFANRFVALFRLLKSESGKPSIFAWLDLLTTIVTTSTCTVLQAVDEIALKKVVDTWYAILLRIVKKDTIAFRVVEG